MKAVIYDSLGKIIHQIEGTQASVEANLDAGLSYIEVTEIPQLPSRVDINLLEVVVLPNQPSIQHVFNYQSLLWEAPISVIRYNKWGNIKSMREQYEFGKITWNNNVYDADIISQQRIQGAAQLAQLDNTIQLTWTLANNTTVLLSAADIISLAVALGTHVTQAHTIGRLLRDQIWAATTVEEIEQIAWIDP